MRQTGVKKIEGSLNANGKRFAIVAARFNDVFVEKLLSGACDTLFRSGCTEDNITIIRVPGSFEIPCVVKHLALSKEYHAIIALGALIRGETDHYDLIAKEVASGINRVAIDTGVPVAFGVITTENMEQALARSGAKAGNKGAEAAAAAIEMANVCEQLKR